MISDTPQRDRRVPLKDQDASHLRTVAPWCASIVDDAQWQHVSMHSRRAAPDGEDSLKSFTLGTPTTLSHWSTFYKQNTSGGEVWGELACIVGLGTGLNGHKGILHGGMFSLILDEVLTFLATIHRTPRSSGFTAMLKVDFKAPIPTPSTILVKGQLLNKSSGRKAWVRGAIEDGNGKTFATADALIVEGASPKA